MTELELNPHALLFDVRRSIRYHTWRRRFFDGRYRVTTAVAIILGSASVVTVLTQFDPMAAEWAKAFQRASSAVEGRNGYLSQMHHNHRGLPKRRYQVWTVLHNFDCRASDGTTSASRFFRREFPDLPPIGLRSDGTVQTHHDITGDEQPGQ